MSDGSVSPAELSLANRWTASLLGGGFIAAAVALGVYGLADVGRLRLFEVIALVVLYAWAFNTEFRSPVGSGVPTQPVLVGLLFIAPLPVVPLAVLLGQNLSFPGSRPRRSTHRLFVDAIAGFHCLGPVLVFAAANAGPPRLSQWPVYIAALGAQYVFDAASAVVRAAAIGTPLRELISPVGWTLAGDALLAPAGLSAVIAANGSAQALWFIAAPVALVWLLSHDRRVKAEEVETLGQAMEAARSEARLDPLTQLANRRAWREAVAEAAGRLDDSPLETVVTVVFADLDSLKQANDTLGHEAGDLLICEMAECLRAVAPVSATIARLGGDEFAILLVEPLNDSMGHTLADSLRREISSRTPLAGHGLSASVGTASCPPEDHPAVALRVADERAYADKAARRATRDNDLLSS
jgi:diguanylate cyclase (GGDEF)-like protein